MKNTEVLLRIQYERRQCFNRIKMFSRVPKESFAQLQHILSNTFVSETKTISNRFVFFFLFLKQNNHVENKTCTKILMAPHLVQDLSKQLSFQPMTIIYSAKKHKKNKNKKLLTCKMAEENVKLKLTDEEKSTLIDFYKNNKALWCSSTSFRDKEEK